MIAQLLLEFLRLDGPIPSFDNFIVGDNEELLASLTATDPRGLCYLFGVEGSGKTHLLKAKSSSIPASIYLDVGTDFALAALPIDDEEKFEFLAVDNVDKLDETGQHRLFHLCNLVLRGRLSMAIAGHAPPSALGLRDDLRMRLSQGLVYAIVPLTDDQKLDALRNHVAAKSMVVDDEILCYLLRHADRSLTRLTRLLDLLDEVSLTRRQKPTLPMVRTLLIELAEKNVADDFAE